MNDDAKRKLVKELSDFRDGIIEETAVFVASIGHPRVADAIRLTKGFHEHPRKTPTDTASSR